MFQHFSAVFQSEGPNCNLCVYSSEIKCRLQLLMDLYNSGLAFSDRLSTPQRGFYNRIPKSCVCEMPFVPKTLN